MNNAGMMNTGLNSPCNRSTQVGCAIEELEKEIERAYELAEVLEERLGRVLMPELPKDMKLGEEPKALKVALADQLDHLSQKVSRVSSRLNSVMNRCEL